MNPEIAIQILIILIRDINIDDEEETDGGDNIWDNKY